MITDELINVNMSYETDSSSLCTLCVLEASVNVFENFSSSLSLDDQTLSSFNKEKNLTPLQQNRLKKMKVENDWRKQDESIFEDTKRNLMMNDKKIFEWTGSQHEKNNDLKLTTNNRPQEENNAILKCSENFFKYFQKADKNNALFNELSSQKDEGNETEQQREQSTLFSLSCMSQTLSMEIGMLPKISQTIINQVISNTNDDFVQRQKNTKGLHNIDEPINDRQQGSILKASMQIARNATDTGRVASKMNSLHQSKKNFQLGITNEEKYLKKVQFSIAPDLGNTSPNETLKRNINNDVIERVTAIPKKKPKIISQEVLKVPLQHFSFGREHPAIEDSKAPEGDDKFKKSYQEIETCSSIDRSRRKISNVEEQTNFKEGTEKADTTRTGEVLQNPSKLSSVSCKKTVPKRVSTLLMLQRKIDENSIRLLSQVKEMKKLSSLIDELRRNFGSEKTAVAKVSPTKWEPTKKEFVSRCTQTTDSHPMTIDVNDPTRPAVLMTAASSAKLSEKENDSRPNVETKIHKSRHTLFHPVILKNVENTVPKSVSSKCLIISKTLSHHTPIILDHQLSADKTWTPKTVESQQNANSSVQFDPYYNPLRPRRWPRKKNNQSVFRPNNQPKKIEGSYSPLPVVIKKMMSTNVTQ